MKVEGIGVSQARHQLPVPLQAPPKLLHTATFRAWSLLKLSFRVSTAVIHPRNRFAPWSRKYWHATNLLSQQDNNSKFCKEKSSITFNDVLKPVLPLAQRDGVACVAASRLCRLAAPSPKHHNHIINALFDRSRDHERDLEHGSQEDKSTALSSVDFHPHSPSLTFIPIPL